MTAFGNTPGESIKLFGFIISGPAVGVAIREPAMGVEAPDARNSDGRIICCCW
jgi:hypothetical protein